MTKDQKIYRLEMKYDFLEGFLANMLYPGYAGFLNKKQAVDFIRELAEKHLEGKGIKYPFKDSDK